MLCLEGLFGVCAETDCPLSHDYNPELLTPSEKLLRLISKQVNTKVLDIQTVIDDQTVALDNIKKELEKSRNIMYWYVNVYNTHSSGLQNTINTYKNTIDIMSIEHLYHMSMCTIEIQNLRMQLKEKESHAL